MNLAFPIALSLSLAACASNPGKEERKIDDGGLPSAEVKAFERAHAQYQYKDARIEWDSTNCAVYEGAAPTGQRQQKPLTDEGGRRFCHVQK
ncbi:hypothetical protein [Xanthomonas cannabis]|uniref:hypothetical protein n=1 Tax=Xanthomonas cannabis TaxID=1885674 RepID=UPI00141BE456|nr:hypothetical protein [Xanthomonas cannabis]NIK18437.1 hypothetical protein [Xanthomonas cannabis]